MAKIVTHRDLDVYQLAFEAAVKIFDLTRTFPREELYSLTDQVRKASRSVCSNLAEAWRKRRYPAAFISKLSDSEGEAAEVQVWIEFAVRFDYVDKKAAEALYRILFISSPDARGDDQLSREMGDWPTPILIRSAE